MIGVIAKPEQSRVVAEFFELFKTPWEPYRSDIAYDVVLVSAGDVPQVQAKLLMVFDPKSGAARQGQSVAAGGFSLPIYGEGAAASVREEQADSLVIWVGYDLFAEVEWLLRKGQPVEQAHVPTLELHIQLLREWILGAGLSLIEIPPVAAGYSFVACLTHDIDFVGIRRHFLDHSMWGFVQRATVGSLTRMLKGRLSFGKMLRNWLATASLPFVFLGWAKDFWEPFEWYLNVERGLPVTYFLIPFKRRAGDRVNAANPARRATAYDIGDLGETVPVLQKHGAEIGVHGIDSWNSATQGREELARVAQVAKTAAGSEIGIRMHWLLRDEDTPAVLEQAGYAYDSTFGYNDAVGYRSGTVQVFRPLNATTLLEMPLHIQDGALFYPKRLALTEAEAQKQCDQIIGHAEQFGGVLTLLWHDRSHGPERWWGDFYVKLIDGLKARKAWFASAAQVVGWFRKRRAVRFEIPENGSAVRVIGGEEIQPLLTIRIHRPGQKAVDTAWDGTSARDIDALGRVASALAFSYSK